jgi:hypothetical protein
VEGVVSRFYSEWSDSLADELARPFPASVVKYKKKGGASIAFVSWHIYAARLSQIVGPHGWSAAVTHHFEVGGKLALAVTVTILGHSQTQVGTAEEDKDDYGDAATNAWAQAFKRACASFGLGLSMYHPANPLPPPLTPEEREHTAMIVYLTANGGNAPPDLQDRIRQEWKQAKSDPVAAATLVGLVEEVGGPKFQSPA